MGTDKSLHLSAIITQYESQLPEGWVSGLMTRMIRRDKSAEAELRQQAKRFLPLLVKAIDNGATADIEAAA